MTMSWRLAPGLQWTLDRPYVLGIVNVTPDSFANDQPLLDPRAAAAVVQQMVDEGAHAVDIGGESTRPGAVPVPPDEELRRVLPLVRTVRALAGPAGRIPITIDTTKAAVARAALDAGATAINDVSAGETDPGMLPLAGSAGCGIVLMHRLTTPQRDSYSDRYTTPPPMADVVTTVSDALHARMRAAREAGIARDAVLVDPGLGFGKSVEQNLELLQRSPELSRRLDRPVLSALSRKSFVGRAGLGRDSLPAERLEATLALSVLHLAAGARVFRVHDVQAHRRALDAAWATLRPTAGSAG